MPAVKKIKWKKETVRPCLNLACEYYGDNKLKQKDVRPLKLVDLKALLDTAM